MILVIWLYIISYRIKYDTIIAFTGGLGSGKSFLSVKYAIRLLKKQRFKVGCKNIIRKIVRKSLEERPMLYSSIPVRISKKEWSIELTEEHLLLRERINKKSVVYIDEIGSYANQYEYKNPNIKDNFDEFIRLFRNYTMGGYLVVNDQCSENIVLTVRRRINMINNLMSFRHFLFIYWVRIRNISVSEEIKTIEENNKESNTSIKFGIFPMFWNRKTYDTYCYSERYNTVVKGKEEKYKIYKKNKLMRVSEVRKESLTSDCSIIIRPVKSSESVERTTENKAVRRRSGQEE